MCLSCGKDVFIDLPTGSGKSLSYFILSETFNELLGVTHSVVIVVSPLIALMRKQVTVVAPAVCGTDLPASDHSSVHIGDLLICMYES